LAATGPLHAARFITGRCRGQKTPPTEPQPQAPAVARTQPRWERPWPRLGRCMPLASAQAAVGVRRPLPQNPSHRLQPWPGLNPGGSGLGRDSADACRWRRHRPLSGSEDPSHRTPATGSSRGPDSTPVRAALAATRPMHAAGVGTGRCRGQKTPLTEPQPQAPAVARTAPLWERPWPRLGRCRPPSRSENRSCSKRIRSATHPAPASSPPPVSPSASPSPAPRCPDPCAA
jgi:hypothetical protein